MTSLLIAPFCTNEPPPAAYCGITLVLLHTNVIDRLYLCVRVLSDW